MNKTLIEVAKIFILILLVIGIESCSKDNPVKPEDPIPEDTVDLYEWKAIGFSIAAIYTPDSANIYSCHPYRNQVFHWDGANTFTEIYFNDPEFSPRSIGGFNKDIVYVGGHKSPPGSNSRAHLCRISGTNIIKRYDFPDSSSGVANITCPSTDEVWFSGAYGRVYNIKNDVIKEYILRPANGFFHFYFDENNTMFAFSTFIGTGGTPDILLTYRFDGNSFNLLRKDTVDVHGTGISSNIYNCGKDMIMVGVKENVGTSLWYFNGLEWVFIQNTDFHFPIIIGGYGRDSLISLSYYYGQTDFFNNSLNEHVFTKTRKGWKRERGAYNALAPFMFAGVMGGVIKFTNNGKHVYVMINGQSESALLIGKIKNKK